ncbi:GntR family transcriptional regulator [Paenarthrobacter sp. NPDC058040]|uniref:GntR family transcriptional regulator n=1 Tax=unclassified Paenarthrobacter TaxID=2634190 RepID=UPI0036D96B61
MEIAERGEEIGDRLRHAIELGLLEDGEQLPSENDLAAMMGVSTQTLRTALSDLRHQGFIETRRGRGGGSFVKANGRNPQRAHRERLHSYSLEDLRDLREFRAALAGAAAAAAASRSQQIPLERLVALAGIVGDLDETADITRADSRFHIELASASSSVRLTRQEVALQAEVGALLWSHSTSAGPLAATEHVAIAEAIRVGDANGARVLAEDHVRHDMNRLIDQRMALDLTGPVSATETDRAIKSIDSMTEKVTVTASGALEVVQDTVFDLLDDPDAGGDPLGTLDAVLRRTLGEASHTLNGLGIFLTDPSFFGETGFVWYYKPLGSETPQRVYQDLQYYDFRATAWWPKEDNPGLHTSHAYVDANGHAYIIDFSKRVTTPDGRLIGVAGADVLVSHLQTIFAPLLAPLPQGSSIIDRNGVVIATNSGRMVGGTYPPAESAEAEAGKTPAPWRLHVV